MEQSAQSRTDHDSLPMATAAETTAVINEVYIPIIAKGAIIRRPGVVKMAEHLGLDGRAIRRLQQLSDKYGRGPLMLRVPKWPMALVLDPDHVHRLLEETPEPFATAERAKRSALNHFEPEVALISHGKERTERTRFNREALDDGNPIHSMAEKLMPVIEEEAAELLQTVQQRNGTLSWDDYVVAWYRVVRRVVLGDSARDDHDFTELLADLRANANWGFLRHKDTAKRERFLEQLSRYLEQAEPGSLAAYMAGIPKNEDTSPENQVPQWLFAFDPAAMASFRALALLAAHPDQAARAQVEIFHHKSETCPELNLLRASVLESLRLWPTTPMILRQTTEPTQWERGTMPAGTSLLIFAPYFHRDDRFLSYANSYLPDLWLRPRTREDWPLVPFSGGTGICPGRHLVLLLTSNMMAKLIEGRRLELTSHRLLDSEPMPALLNNYELRFKLHG